MDFLNQRPRKKVVGTLLKTMREADILPKKQKVLIKTIRLGASLKKLRTKLQYTNKYILYIIYHYKLYSFTHIIRKYKIIKKWH